MTDFAGLNIGECPDHTIVHGGQIHGGKRPQEAAVRGRSMDIGIVSGHRVIDEKPFQRLGVVGVVVYQGFDQKAVIDINALIFG